ncbi:MAG: hypothetical protein AUK32_10460 [Candidatus Aquicultor secundus]|nr:MAG: hypothetical protein AUK32_10460 [Candidatus Aquicultor secundus]
MNPHKSALSDMLLRFAAAVALFALCLCLIPGCQQPASPSGSLKSARQPTKEKILYVKNGIIYETGLSGSHTRKIFSANRYNPWGAFLYLLTRFYYTENLLNDFWMQHLTGMKRDDYSFILPHIYSMATLTPVQHKTGS